MTIILIIISILSSYLIGSIPFAYIIARSKGIDIFSVGSGNCGASNVLRVVGKKEGILAYFTDISKGALAIIIAYFVVRDLPNMSLILVVCALSAVVGHIFSVFLKFRGGKGVAVACGAMFMLCPISLLSALVFFAIGLVVSKKVIAIGSTFAAITFPIFITIYHFYVPMLYKPFFNLEYKYIMPFISLLMLFIIIKHIPNYKRLLAGKENSFGKK